MARTCTICTHRDRATIDEALLAGTSFRNIAERFGTSATALYRHKRDHIPVTLARSHEIQEVARADGLLNQVRSLHEKTLKTLLHHEDLSDWATLGESLLPKR